MAVGRSTHSRLRLSHSKVSVHVFCCVRKYVYHGEAEGMAARSLNLRMYIDMGFTLIMLSRQISCVMNLMAKKACSVRDYICSMLKKARGCTGFVAIGHMHLLHLFHAEVCLCTS